MWDVFISHASEDKIEVVDPLAAILEQRGLSVWYDNTALTLGDSLRRKIDEGLAGSRFGIVILSHCFFAKKWPQSELDALFAREVQGTKVVLPVWHQLELRDILGYSPLMADRLAASTKNGLEAVAEEIVRAVQIRNQTAFADGEHEEGAASAGVPANGQPAIVSRLRRLAARINVQDPGNSRRHVRAFTQEALLPKALPSREIAIEILKERLGFVASEAGAPGAVRRLRQEIFRSIKALAIPTFGSCFADGELEGMDLYGVDFSGADLRNVNFRDAFLVEADFQNAHLDEADFTGSYLRNANFALASLVDATLTDADWFNAAGFDRSQLTAVRPGTIKQCPVDMRAMEAYLPTKYGFSMDSWDSQLQNQLRDNWRRYLAEDGFSRGDSGSIVMPKSESLSETLVNQFLQASEGEVPVQVRAHEGGIVIAARQLQNEDKALPARIVVLDLRKRREGKLATNKDFHLPDGRFAYDAIQLIRVRGVEDDLYYGDEGLWWLVRPINGSQSIPMYWPDRPISKPKEIPTGQYVAALRVWIGDRNVPFQAGWEIDGEQKAIILETHHI